LKNIPIELQNYDLKEGTALKIAQGHILAFHKKVLTLTKYKIEQQFCGKVVLIKTK